jgi:hypothetical protein
MQGSLLLASPRDAGGAELARHLSTLSGMPVVHLDQTPEWCRYREEVGDAPPAPGLARAKYDRAVWGAVDHALEGLNGPTIVEGHQLLAYPALADRFRVYLFWPDEPGFVAAAGEEDLWLAYATTAARPNGPGTLHGMIVLWAPAFVGWDLARAIVMFEAKERLVGVSPGPCGWRPVLLGAF